MPYDAELYFQFMRLFLFNIMCKFYQLEKTNFEFNILDISSEFKESFNYVFEHKKGKLFFVFKTGIKKELKKEIKIKEDRHGKNEGTFNRYF